MTQRTRFILFGAGHWHAAWHLDALVGAGQEIAAVGALEAQAARRIGERFSVPYFTDEEEMLSLFPDAVALVLTRPDLTPALLMKLIDAGMPFILEKPGACDAAALVPVLAAAEEKSLPTMVPLVNRSMAFWRELVSISSAPAWTHAHFRILAGPPSRYIRDGVGWVLDPARSGGGALRNLGIHAADAALVLARDEPIEVMSAGISNVLHGLPVEDFAFASLRVGGSRSITIEAGYCMPSETTTEKEWRIHGPGWAIAENNGLLSVRTPKGRNQRNSPPSAEQYAEFGSEMARFARAGKAGVANLRDLVSAQMLIDMIYARAVHLGTASAN